MDIYVAPTNVGIETDGGMFNPSVFQGNENSCAIHSQYHVLRDYGYTGTVEDLKAEAEANGWYDPATGTSPENVGKLLEAHGVPCNVYVNANEYNLISELAQGKRVIVGLDSGEIWEGEGVLQDFWEKITGGGADHAVVVSGINTADPDNIKVVLTDSGAGHAAIEYPLDQFMDAWKDGECTMWVPQDPPKPEFNLDRLINFDWGRGHIASVGDISYEELVSQQNTFDTLQVTEGESWWEEIVAHYEELLVTINCSAAGVSAVVSTTGSEAVVAAADVNETAVTDCIEPTECMADTVAVTGESDLNECGCDGMITENLNSEVSSDQVIEDDVTSVFGDGGHNE